MHQVAVLGLHGSVWRSTLDPERCLRDRTCTPMVLRAASVRYHRLAT